ncbi:MAG: hypothetical protein H8E31_00400 [Planctomycetes bacterium]|nr:hypothetical protein [Planctomycetota bacterium]
MSRLSLFISATLLLLGASRATAQSTYTVDLVGTSFSPASLTIDEGDTVIWNWVSGLHNVNSVDGLFLSGAPVTAPNTYSITFDTAFLAAAPANGNVYSYQCDVHVGFGMTGAVTVLTGNPVLTVTGLVAGSTASLTVTDCLPFARVGYAYSLVGPGPGLASTPCGPVTVSLSAPFSYLSYAIADASGTAVLNVPVPAGAANVAVWIQAMDLLACELSNGATMVVG